METASQTGHRSAVERSRTLRIFVEKDHHTRLDLVLAGMPLSCVWADTWIDADVAQTTTSGSELTIHCQTGQVAVGRMQFDHVWTPNQEFQRLWPDLWTRIRTNNFNLDDLQDHDLRTIETVGLFSASGAGVFDGWEDLRVNPTINGVLQRHSPEYQFPPHQIFLLYPGDRFACDLTIPEPVS